MTYARSRLWLGISGVGFQVVVASGALWFGLPHRLLSGVSAPVAIALTLACFIALSIPSDVLGGYYLPRLHGRSKIDWANFLGAWGRGVAAQAVVVGLCGGAILEASQWGGTWAGVGCFVGLMVLLLAGQWMLGRLVGGLSVQGRLKLPRTAVPMTLPTVVCLSSDPGFVGGIVGLPGRERLIVPAAWSKALPPQVLATELTRRQGALATGARTRGVIVALGWNALGFALACHLPGASLADAAGLVQTALWFTLWSFVGLLTLPSVNRPGVLEADRFALDRGIAAPAIAAAISRLDGLQDDEPSRTRWIERIFHPIPSVERRIAALREADSARGAWQCARMTLYLSWACFGFLSRAVHCNAGRPELWVLFPGD